MFDPMHKLSFSLQANPGVYALLLGSGISRAAGIPTGYEIILDVIHQLANMHGESEQCEPNPTRWYTETYRRFPNYSEILENLFETPTERQQKLRSYIEPTSEERERDLKKPTVAHRAIADLVARGFLKVIITTNFDRLLEIALRDAAVEPIVLSSVPQIEGAIPLVHTRCCIIKLHGDYLDPVTLNTLEELEAYSEELDERLDRILDEYGLIVCGWSGDWDIALRNALLRARTRRFPTYWASRGEVSRPAEGLIGQRRANVIYIEDADHFFQQIKENVDSIEEFTRPHPLSTEVVVTSLKRYLPEPKHQIRLADLIQENVERVVSESAKFTYDSPQPNMETVTNRVRSYDAICSTLMSMGAVGGRWAEDDHFGLWQRAIQRLSELPLVTASSHLLWLELQRYPASILLYTLGLGAVESGRLQLLSELFTTIVGERDGVEQSAVQLLTPYRLFHDGSLTMRENLEDVRNNTPISYWLHRTLRSCAVNVIPSEARYTLAFDKLEILMALNYGYQKNDQSDWLPLGKFAYERPNRQRALQELRDSITGLDTQSPWIRANIFGNNVEVCTRGLDNLESYVGGLNW